MRSSALPRAESNGSPSMIPGSILLWFAPTVKGAVVFGLL
jgi:hypothetical protein